MRHRRKSPDLPDQSPAAAADASARCQSLLCVQARFRWCWQSGFSTGICRGGTGIRSAGEPQSQPSRVWKSEISPHDPESTRPARFIKKVDDHVCEERQSIACAAQTILVGRSDKRPVNEHGTTDHVIPWNEAPVTAVVTYVAVISHGEIAVRGHNDVIAL